jgi:hypothetical protein
LENGNMSHRTNRSTLRALMLSTAVLVPAGLLQACASKLPCLQYSPQNFTRTVTMHGHGSFQVTEERLVCTLRDTGNVEDLIGP